jgi:hypothetical protein
VTNKSAWRMFNLIRNQLMADDTGARYVEIVEPQEVPVAS